MKFRTALLLSVLALVAGILLATVAAVGAVLERSAREALAQDLARDRAAYAELRAFREALYQTQAQVLAEEPRLKAVVSSAEITPETVMGVAQSLRKGVGSDLFVITDAEGRVVADVADPRAQGQSLARNPLVAEALARGAASGVWVTEGRPYQVAAHRLAFGAETVGALVLGFVLDDQAAASAAGQLGTSLALGLEGRVVAASALEGGATADRAGLAQALSAPAEGPPAELALGGDHYLALGGALPGYQGGALRFALLRSLDRALAPARRLTWAVLAIAGAALLLGLLLASFIARRLSQPVQELVGLTTELAAGRLQARLQPRGPQEVQALALAMNTMAGQLEEGQRQAAAKQRLEKELEIASRIQTSMLPRSLSARRLEVAARMNPATEVGGDYYDLLPVADGCWVGIGDVAGHGLTAGLVMMMIQSVVSALCRQRPDASPKGLVCLLNEVLYENIRTRLANDEHVTFTLLRFFDDGRLVYAGAHEEILVARAKTGKVEHLNTPGSWLGARKDISRVTTESTAQLEPGDLVLLHTDGLTEAMDAKREQFGSERLEAALATAQHQSVEAVRDAILARLQAFCPQPADDVTVVVLRYQGPA